MYKIFRNIGLIILIVMSFIYTNKLVGVVKEYDDIMIQIKENKDKYSVNKEEAIINKDTIIPGINGKKVNVDLSYNKMREKGNYDNKLFVYDNIDIKDKLEDNIDKYVIKGRKNMKVSIILKLNTNDNIIDTALNIYADNTWLNKNKINQNIILLNNDSGEYCYTEEKDTDILNKCIKRGKNTIIPTLIIKDNSLINVEKYLESGIIITCNKYNYKNISNYIRSKGYEIVSLKELLEE